MNNRFRLILSAILSIIIIIISSIGIVFLTIPGFQVLCAVIALLGSLYLKLIWKHLSAN